MPSREAGKQEHRKDEHGSKSCEPGVATSAFTWATDESSILSDKRLAVPTPRNAMNLPAANEELRNYLERGKIG